jgi:hypothetical protein
MQVAQYVTKILKSGLHTFPCGQSISVKALPGFPGFLECMTRMLCDEAAVHECYARHTSAALCWTAGDPVERIGESSRTFMALEFPID